MSASSNEDKIPQEYVNNENPFAYIRDYFENPFLDPAIKPKLDALQQIQPKFIPLGIDLHTLKAEQMIKTNMVIEEHIREMLNKGMKLIGNTSILNREAILRENIEVPGVIDILIDIGRLRLLHSQGRLREKVYSSLKSNLPSNIVNAIDYSEPLNEDYLASALEYGKLEKITSSANQD